MAKPIHFIQKNMTTIHICSIQEHEFFLPF